MAQGAISGGNPVEDVHTRTTTSGPQSQVAVLGVDGSDSVVFAHATRGVRVDLAGSAVFSVRKTIATAGTPAQLTTSSSPCKSVYVVALPTNTARVAIGGSAVDAADVTFNGIPLDPMQGVSIDVSDTNLVYLDVLVDGNGVSMTLLS
jgi:hypothetical protein